MARTDVATVRGVLSTSQNAAVTDDQVTAAINAATIVVDRLAGESCHTTDSLAAVETYYAAHIVVQTTGGGETTEQKMGDATEKKNRSTNGTSSYLQTAQMLDCSGQLVNFGKTGVVIEMFGGAGE